MSDVVDITIIGAGVIGLAIAEALTQKTRPVVILERTTLSDRKPVPATAR